MLETTEHDVRKICDAECFIRNVIEPGRLRQKDILLLDMEFNQNGNFQLINLILNSNDCPALVFLADDAGAFQPHDTFVNPRLDIMHKPINAQTILAHIELLL